MTGKIKKIIDEIIQERSKGNPAIAEMTKAKFILKGINPDRFDSSSADDSIIINKLVAIAKQLNVKSLDGERSNIKSVLSTELDEKEAVKDIKNKLNGFDAKIVVFFASSCFDHNKMSNLLQESFRESIVFGCSTAGEIVGGALLRNSVVAMAFNSTVISDAKVEVVELMKEDLSVEAAFTSFERYFNESCYTMDVARYVGIVLIDGISMKEEKLMDQIGNRSNVYFIGGSAGDDRKYDRTFVCANGMAYADSAILVLMKMNDYAEFDIIKTQSYKVLDDKLIANKVNEEAREVIEFNNRPAILAYADAVGAASIEEASKYFPTHPVGLIMGENDIFVRSPQEKRGTNIKFYCNLLEGMEVRLLESTNIIEDTKNALENKMNGFGQIEGIINFQCVLRTLELEKKNVVKQYEEIFKGIENIGFSTYGEEYIGHTNQTSTMLVFKSKKSQGNNNLESSPHIETQQKQSLKEQVDEELIKENIELKKILRERNDYLEETIAALKEFNIILEEEISERTKREEEIKYLSYHDKLTGLYNRRFYEEEIKRVDTKRNLPISIIMGDVNGLKLVNDVFGHEKGDGLLKKAAAGIQISCREDDIAARWGGDEFVVLLPKTNKEEVEEIVNRIKEQYTKQPVSDINVSISFGWDTKNNSDEDILTILKRAEDYMYENKRIEKVLMEDK